MSANKESHHRYEYDGEPGCRTGDELSRMFRHFWDPTTYWQCEAKDKKARLMQCPQAHLFSDKHGKCVHYADWEWTDPTEPPSRPAQ